MIFIVAAITIGYTTEAWKVHGLNSPDELAILTTLC